MSELDELVKLPGVLMVGRFGYYGHIGEDKTTRALTGVMQWF